MSELQKKPFSAFSGYIWVACLAASQLLTSFTGFSPLVLGISIFSSALFFYALLKHHSNQNWTDYELFGIVGVVLISSLTHQIYTDSGLIRFIWDGLIQHYDINPFETVPASQEVMGLHSEPIYSFIGQKEIPTPFSPFLLIFAKFSALLYLSAGFSVSILVTKFSLALITAGSLIWGYSKGLYTQKLVLAFLLNPLTLVMIGQGQPLLMLVPVLVLSLYLWEMQDDFMFWLIWGVVWFLSPAGIVLSLLLVFKTKGKSMLGLVTYLLWWIPFLSVSNVEAFIQFSLLHVPETSIISSLYTVSDLISQITYYSSYVLLAGWFVWSTVKKEITPISWHSLVIPLFLLPADFGSVIIIVALISYLYFESTPKFVSISDIPFSSLTFLFSLILLAGALSITYAWILVIQVAILISFIAMTLFAQQKHFKLP